jgi:hypothetical protein
MSVKNCVKAIPLTSIDSSTFTGSYQAINTGGLPFPCYIIRINNDSTENVTISYDGTTDHEFLPTLLFTQLTFQGNPQPNGYYAVLPAGTVVYVKGTAGTGLVYLSGYYMPNSI